MNDITNTTNTSNFTIHPVSAPTSGFEVHRSAPDPDMVNVQNVVDGLDLGDYGECLNDYSGCSGRICDYISEIADSHTSIYYSDIRDFIAKHFDAVDDYINEYGWPGYLDRAGQGAEFLLIEADIYNHLEDALTLVALDYWRYTLKNGGLIPRDLVDTIQSEVGDCERMDEVLDIVDLWITDEREDT